MLLTNGGNSFVGKI